MQQSVRTTHELGHVQFFRLRLLIASPEQISKFVDTLDKEASSIRADALKLAWHMRGGITYDQVMQLSAAERKMIGDLAKENIETTKKSGLPWF